MIPNDILLCSYTGAQLSSHQRGFIQQVVGTGPETHSHTHIKQSQQDQGYHKKTHRINQLGSCSFSFKGNREVDLERRESVMGVGLGEVEVGETAIGV